MIEGKTVRLCPFDRRHLAKTRAWANDLELARLLDRSRPVSDGEHERWYESLLGRTDCIFFAIETIADSRHIGNVWLWGIDFRHRKAELRIVIGDRECTGRGLGSEAIQLLCDFGFERANLHKIFAYVLGTNPRGCRAFEKAGFVSEGILREDRWVGDRYADVHLLARFAAAATSAEPQAA